MFSNLGVWAFKVLVRHTSSILEEIPELGWRRHVSRITTCQANNGNMAGYVLGATGESHFVGFDYCNLACVEALSVSQMRNCAKFISCRLISSKFRVPAI